MPAMSASGKSTHSPVKEAALHVAFSLNVGNLGNTGSSTEEAQRRLWPEAVWKRSLISAATGWNQKFRPLIFVLPVRIPH